MILGAFLGLSVASCADQNFDWEDAKSQNPEYVFRSNFEKLVGPIDPNQSWDFSSNAPTYGTRAAGDTLTGQDGVEETFNADFRQALSIVLTEGKDNHTIGSSYTLISQGPFDIYPLWHGKCMEWDLYVNDIKIGGYSDIMSKMKSTTTYEEASTTQLTTNGWRINLPVGTPVFIKLVITGGRNYTYYANKGDIVTSVYNPPVPYKSGKISNGSLVLPVTKDYTYKDNWGRTQSATYTQPANLDMVIMFEDAKTRYGDADFNDFVLGIKGRPTKPTEIEVIDGEYEVPTPICKRYMVEDLGSTAETDIDFNDLVVDLIDTTFVTHKTTITIQDGEEKVTDVVVGDPRHAQYAQIRAMGGTLDFEFGFVNNGTNTMSFKKSTLGVPGIQTTTMWNTGLISSSTTISDGNTIDYSNANISIDLTSTIGNKWVPETNNIYFKVTNRDESTATSSKGDSKDDFSSATPFYFPEPGDVPYIIAYDLDKLWRKERQPVCSDWIHGDLNGSDVCPTHGDKTNYVHKEDNQ